jgi:hypothetical protein
VPAWRSVAGRVDGGRWRHGRWWCGRAPVAATGQPKATAQRRADPLRGVADRRARCAPQAPDDPGRSLVSVGLVTGRGVGEWLPQRRRRGVLLLDAVSEFVSEQGITLGRARLVRARAKRDMLAHGHGAGVDRCHCASGVWTRVYEDAAEVCTERVPHTTRRRRIERLAWPKLSDLGGRRAGRSGAWPRRAGDLAPRGQSDVGRRTAGVPPDLYALANAHDDDRDHLGRRAHRSGCRRVATQQGLARGGWLPSVSREVQIDVRAADHRLERAKLLLGRCRHLLAQFLQELGLQHLPGYDRSIVDEQ